MKTIIITGASKGIGFELVKIALNQNNRVYAISRNIDSFKSFKKNKNLILVKLDITNYKKVEYMVKKHFLDKSVKIDSLINNAGFLVSQKFEEFTMQNAKNIFETNFFAPSFLIQKLIPHFNNGSHVVNISSMGGFPGTSKFPGLSFYSASKGALGTITECLAEELKHKNIHLNTLSLGAVNTEMLKTAFPGYKAPIEPESMASFIYSFVNQAHNFMNGKNIPVSISTP